MTLKMYGSHTIPGLQQDMVYGPKFIVHLVLRVVAMAHVLGLHAEARGCRGLRHGLAPPETALAQRKLLVDPRAPKQPLIEYMYIYM